MSASIHRTLGTRELYFTLAGPGFNVHDRVPIALGETIKYPVNDFAAEWELWDAPVGGNMLMWGVLPQHVHARDTVTFTLELTTQP